LEKKIILIYIPVISQQNTEYHQPSKPAFISGSCTCFASLCKKKKKKKASESFPHPEVTPNWLLLHPMVATGSRPFGNMLFLQGKRPI